ncbi:DUF4862 family protein [Microlunatus sp. GCM10028923]|uniref:DUF4862 family protein n=1 Tax=Microlunatus sp. GCM10028923 TaxID=3273400 RepID=UPI0036221D1D
MRLIAGAYPAAPPESADQAAFLSRLTESDLIGGLELPFIDDEERWLAGALPTEWRHVVTAAPVTGIRSRNDPAYGLASTDPAGRREAVAVTRSIRDAIERSGLTVAAIELQSAPSRTGTPEALAESLSEIADWDWSGAAILLEHCDAVMAGHEPEKGFLALADELSVARDLGLGVVINWARSVIETRSPEGAVAHVREAGELLSGLIFSGVADVPLNGHSAWVDAHLPPAPIEPASLLTAEHIARTRAAGRPDVLLGAKVRAGTADRSPKQRAESVLEALHLVITSA